MKLINYLKKRTSKKIKRSILKIIVFPYYVFDRFICGRNIYIRWDSSDVNVYFHTFIEHDYSLPYTIDKPQFIIDAGANIGLTALLFNQQYPLAKILAIEPENSNFKILLKNTESIRSIIPLQKGLWSKDVNLVIKNPENEKWSFITNEVENNEPHDIIGISVDSLLKEFEIETIDIFKIDIEGAEKEIFSKNIENWIKKTKWIVIEIHGEECKFVFENAMKTYGFKHIFTNGENQYYINSQLVFLNATT